ncbi:Transcriptional activator HAP3 [Spathaspora sp. JA1]|nr:Transcriptional activator HAP3 [Spathaspora sp. JA1]
MEPRLQDIELREQDRWLPIANVARLMKNTLPNTAKVSKDAKECMQECVSEFISFVTSEASDKCLREKRKTINGEDILYSMHDLGFENYAEVLKIYLAKYREQQALRQERGETRATKRQLKQAAAAAAAAANDDENTTEQAVAVAIGQENEASSSTESGSATGTGSIEGSVGYDGTIKEENEMEEEVDEEEEQEEDVPYLNGDSIDQEDAVNSRSRSPAASEHFYSEFEQHTTDTKIKHEERIEEQHEPAQEHHTKDQYGYDDFINPDPIDGTTHNIEELAKQLTNENGDIDIGIANGATEYF